MYQNTAEKHTSKLTHFRWLFLYEMCVFYFRLLVIIPLNVFSSVHTQTNTNIAEEREFVLISRICSIYNNIHVQNILMRALNTCVESASIGQPNNTHHHHTYNTHIRTETRTCFWMHLRLLYYTHTHTSISLCWRE